jgi:Asp/Glu/hydantoin racemase
MMRLWHQSFAQLDKLPAYRAGLEEHLKKVSAPGTEIVMHGMAPGTHTTMQPGKDIGYSYIQHLHSLQFLESVMQAEREGYDAYLLSTMPDPYLQIAQSLVDIPVVGFGFSSMHTASYLGRRFGIVTFIKELVPYYKENVRKYGLDQLGGPVRHLGLYFDDVQRGFSEPGPVVETFTRVVRTLVEEEGIDTVIPGEAPLGLLLQRSGVHRIDEVPVIDSLATTVKTAEMLVGLRRCSNMNVTRQGYFYARPSEGRIEEALRFYGRK